MTKQNVRKFGLKRIESLKAKQHPFFDLLIDGIAQLEAFENSLEAQYKSEFRTALTIMDMCSNGQSLPKTKMRDITPQKVPVKEYEFKTRNLRFYAIQYPGGKVVVFCGYKNNQASDISRFRSLKDQFLSEQKEDNGKK